MGGQGGPRRRAEADGGIFPREEPLAAALRAGWRDKPGGGRYDSSRPRRLATAGVFKSLSGQ
ncbi:hypothetical protein COMA2_30270 [Candidatus Nitrospira nitrificans]|uniref:Uncharacterized protein n=1 Tax=Candidatus Nitrospira nitrificans TaxID=1742973 RepID=A0A0S4LLN0_9BACT|nr:hypothetical protein COMA2_30270 [Candidatus Nitrospira nitrificans]